MPSKAPAHRQVGLTKANLAAIPDTRLRDDDDRDRGRWWLIALVLLVLLAIGGVAYIASGANTATDQRDTAIDQKLDLATQVAQACASGQIPPTDRLCTKAADAVADPVPGRDGTSGAEGRGVTGTRVVAGRLIVVYSDGTTEDAGLVVGAAGAPGVNGADGVPGTPGRGIVASTIEGGRLVITYSDGARADVGTVVGDDGADGARGPAGRSVVSTANVGDRLIVTYSDGTTQDAGPLPPGPPAPSVRSVTRTYDDGSIERCTRVGGPDSDPVLDCQVTRAPAPDATPEPIPEPLPPNPPR